MARRSLHRLTDRNVKAVKRPGYYCDGGGLYLQVAVGTDGAAHKSWLFRFATGEIKTSRTGKPRRAEREMGLGSYPDTGLAEARAKALDARKQRELGVDPIDARRDQRAAAALAAARAMTFDQCAAAYVAAHRAGWRNAKHAAQWDATLATYARPIIGALPVQTVDTALVMKVLEQEIGDAAGKPGRLWTAKPETASRLRGRMESILDWAKVRGYRQSENPARWRGHLDKLLPARAKVRAVAHHAALAYADMPAFMAELRGREAVAARALEFAILTAARTGEVLGARWDEVDLKTKVWTVPADRMKGRREHRVPLTRTAVTVVERMREVRENAFVFPGDRREQLSNMAFLMLLRRMGRDDLTAHGFRATFKTWATECSNYPREVIEAALAHVTGDKVEAAYQRGDLFEKRRRLMDAWAEFCSKPAAGGRVVPLRAEA